MKWPFSINNWIKKRKYMKPHEIWNSISFQNVIIDGLQSSYGLKQFWKHLEIFEENTGHGVILVRNSYSEQTACNFTKTRILLQIFSWVFPANFQNSFSTELRGHFWIVRDNWLWPNSVSLVFFKVNVWKFLYIQIHCVIEQFLHSS